MTRDELQQAIADTLAEIEQVREQIETAAEPVEELRLMRRKKELQTRQLWNLDQLGAIQKAGE
jgi:hypothetical protein